MSVEIERKFLLKNGDWRGFVSKKVLFRQGYIPSESLVTMRVRIAGDTGYLTIKAPRSADGVSRTEFEYRIPVADAEEMLNRLCRRPLIEKYRHYIQDGGFTWEIDEFLGDNAGLIVAELELPSAETEFSRPDWLGVEVSGDPRYYNSALSGHPYSEWCGKS